MRALIAAVLMVAAISTPAYARHHRHHHYRHRHYRHAQVHRTEAWSLFGGWGQDEDAAPRRRRHARSVGEARGNPYHSTSADPRPREWCAWFLRRKLGIALGEINNLALSFLKLPGRTVAKIGAIVVWSHGGGHGHVGQITGPECGRNSWVVTSGNDGNAVRTRCRYVGNAVGFRDAP